jgi:hypothetical protein
MVWWMEVTAMSAPSISAARAGQSPLFFFLTSAGFVFWLFSRCEGRAHVLADEELSKPPIHQQNAENNNH